MTRSRRWLAALGIAGALLLMFALVAALAVWLWLPDDQQLARHTETKLTSALGVKTTVGTVHWQLLPMPAIVLSSVTTDQSPPISIKKLILHPKLSALVQRHLSFDLIELDGASVPQTSLSQWRRSPEAASLPGGLLLAATPLARFVFSDVSWTARRGIAVVYAGAIDFDEHWRPRTAQFLLPDDPAGSVASLTRTSQDQWHVNIRHGGGKATGNIQVKPMPDGQLRLEGGLKVEAVEVSSASVAFNRKPVLSGKANGNTTVSASGASLAELVQSLKTQTTFVMAPASLLRFDVSKAVRSAGKDHAGRTPLDSVTGAITTQNTPKGTVVSFKNIQARSGALSATGEGTLADRRVKAEFAIDLVDGIVGIPLTVTGPTDKVVVSLPTGAVAGAVVGTAVLPVIGTAIGARVGAAVGKLLGMSPAPPASAARKAKP